MKSLYDESLVALAGMFVFVSICGCDGSLNQPGDPSVTEESLSAQPPPDQNEPLDDTEPTLQSSLDPNAIGPVPPNSVQPFSGAIRHRDGRWDCTAQLVSPNAILAAGHCIYNPGRNPTIRGDVHGASFVLPNGQSARLQHAYADPVNGTLSWNHPHDVVLVILASRLPGPYAIAWPSIPGVGTQLQTVGYGRTPSESVGHGTRHLVYQRVTGTIDLNGGRFILAQGQRRTGICNGDSGGALSDGRYVFGLVSDFAPWSQECKWGNTTTYTPLANDWESWLHMALQGIAKGPGQAI
jgi:hypothetical protein